MYLQKKYNNQYKLLKFNLFQKKYNNCWISHYYYLNTNQYIQIKKYFKKKEIYCYIPKQNLLNSKLLKKKNGIIFFYSNTLNINSIQFIIRKFKFKFLFFKEKKLFSEVLFNQLKFKPINLIYKLNLPFLVLLKNLNAWIQIKANIT